MGKNSVVINVEELKKDIEVAKASGNPEELEAVIAKYRDAINEMKEVKKAEAEAKALEEQKKQEEAAKAAVTEEVAEEPAEEVAEEPVEEIVEEPAEEVAEEPVEEIAEEPVEEPVEEVAEEPAEEVAEEPVEEIAEEVAEEPTEEVVEEPVEEIAEEVAEEPVEEVAEEVTEEPVEEAVEEPVEESSEEAPFKNEFAPTVEVEQKSADKYEAEKKNVKSSKKTPLVDTSKMVVANKPAKQKETPALVEQKPVEETVKETPAEEKAEKKAKSSTKASAAKTTAKSAQTKSTAKSEEKKPEEAETKGRQYNGKYEVYQDGDGYAYTLKASNGEILVVSETYANRDSVLKAIDAVKRNVETGDIKVFADKHGQYKFKLTSKNYRVLALGSNYSTEKSAQRASESFKKFALKANIVDVEVTDQEALNATPIEINAEEKQGGKFIVEVFDKEYSWDLKANNGQILCQSTSYTSRKGCLESIDRFKNAVATGTFKCTKDKKDMYCYKLYGTNGRVCAVGEAYPSKSSAISAANSVVAFYKSAPIIELKEEENE